MAGSNQSGCFFRGQGAAEYLVTLAAVMLIGIAAISVVSSIYQVSGGAAESESAAYWSAQAAPFQVLESQFGNGLSCDGVPGIFTGFKLLLRNSDSQLLALRSVSIGGSQRTFCLVGAQANAAVQFGAGQRRTLNVAYPANCTGNTISAPLSFTYDRSPFTGRAQAGEKPLVARCSSTGLSSQAGEGGISNASQLFVSGVLQPGRVGQAYSSSLSAIGGTQPYFWTFSGLPSGLVGSSGGLISGTPATAGNYTVSATAHDAGSLSGSAPFQLAILPSSGAGQLSVTTTSLQDAIAGTQYSIALTASGGTAPYSWSCSGLPSGLSCSSSGAISGTPAAGSAGSYHVHAVVTDSASSVAATEPDLPLQVLPASPSVLQITTSTPLPSGSAGSAYGPLQLSAIGGTGDYSWSNTTSLPAGLSVSANGSLSGTPSSGGAYSFTIRLQDSSSNSTTKLFGLTVDSGLPDGANCTSSSQCLSGLCYNSTCLATSLPVNSSCTISQQCASGICYGGVCVSSLPLGAPCSNDSQCASGICSGGVCSTCRVSGSACSSGPQCCSGNCLSGSCASPIAITCPASSATMGISYSSSATASGGSGSYSYSLASGSLPSNLSLSPSGLVSGTPTTAQTANFTLRATDSTNNTNTKACSITVSCPAMSITTASLPSGTQGTAYNTTVSATGGSGTYSWSATGLPSGLSISSSTGTISGTPSSSGTFLANVSVNASACGSASKPFNLTITACPAMSITTTSLPSAAQGDAYSYTVTATGGSGTYNWSATGLPASLSINRTTGKISGTANGNPGTYTPNIRVNASTCGSANKSFNLTIVLQSPYAYWYSIASSADGMRLAAGTISGYIYTSADGGASWTEHTYYPGPGAWISIASSSDGMKFAAANQGGYIYTSTNGGATWTEQTGAGSRSWYGIASSSDGMRLAAVDYSNYIYTSTDGGASWTERTSAGSRSWVSIASSSDGTRLAAGTSSSYICTSTDGGATWTTRTSSGSRSWHSIASSSDGIRLAAGDANDYSYIYTSADGGATWTTQTGAGSRYWYGVVSSSDGMRLAAGDAYDYGYIYTSTDGGATWTERTQSGFSPNGWRGIASSSDGTRLAAIPNGQGYVYTSADGGASWMRR